MKESKNLSKFYFWSMQKRKG